MPVYHYLLYLEQGLGCAGVEDGVKTKRVDSTRREKDKCSHRLTGQWQNSMRTTAVAGPN